MITFCTLLDSFYLDKLLALHDSFEQHLDNYLLYTYCFDDRAYEVLVSLELSNVIPILWSEIEKNKPELLIVKKERSKPEYCWTCTSQIIEYTLSNYAVSDCTYIDADMYWFDNPQILYDEIHDSGAHVVIVNHRFPNTYRAKRIEKRSGKYNVAFNYFDQSYESKEALKWWKEKCLEWCYATYENGKHGDQKYLEEFPKLFKGVYELQHLGGDTAPWNLGQYELVGLKDHEKNNNPGIVLKEKGTGKVFPLVLYHFQSIRYISKNKVNICSGTRSKKLKDAIYKPYLRQLELERHMLNERFGIDFPTHKVYASNFLMALYQRLFIALRIRSFSDVVDLTKLHMDK